MRIEGSSQTKNHKITLSSDLLEQVIGALSHKMDHQGDYFYDRLSAFHKSIRGSDPDAAIFWLANMMDKAQEVKGLQVFI